EAVPRYQRGEDHDQHLRTHAVDQEGAGEEEGPVDALAPPDVSGDTYPQSQQDDRLFADARRPVPEGGEEEEPARVSGCGDVGVRATERNQEPIQPGEGEQRKDDERPQHAGAGEGGDKGCRKVDELRSVPDAALPVDRVEQRTRVQLPELSGVDEAATVVQS